MTTHELKCWPTPFGAMLAGSKSFEFRKHDRNFSPGDTLHLREWDPDTESYTGRTLDCLVTYILFSGYGLPDGYCIMSLESAELRKLREENGVLREHRKVSLDVEMRLMRLHNDMQTGGCVEVQYIPNHAGDLIRRLRSTVERLRGALEKARRTHVTCEDGWYSCPKAEGYFGENSTDCTCGADEHNARIAAALAPVEREKP